MNRGTKRRNKKGIGRSTLVGIIILLVSMLVVMAFLYQLFDAAKKSKKGDIEMCKLFVCGTEEMEKQSGGFLQSSPSKYCKTHSIAIPEFSGDENREGIKKEIMRLIASSWYEMCDGPDPSAWRNWKNVFSDKKCFPTYYFEIKKTFDFDEQDVIPATELEWDMMTTDYKQFADEDGNFNMYTYTAYVQYYDTAGRIDVQTDFKVGEIYAIAVADPVGLKIWRDTENIPHVFVVEASKLRGECDEFN
jgi:hypothetical protein